MTMMTTRVLKQHRQLRRHARRAKTLNRVAAVDDVAVVAAVAVVVMKSKRRHLQAALPIQLAILWILMTTSARLCSKKIRKISSACQLAAQRLNVVFRTSLLRRRLESLSRRTTQTMKRKRVMTLSDRQRAKAVQAVRDAAAAVAEGVVEDAKTPANPFVRKNARPPVYDARCAMKIVWTTTRMTTIWPVTMLI